MKRLIIIFLMLILLLPNVQALKMLSGDQVSVDSPIDDDVFVSGGTVTLNAPVASAVIAGGTIIINAPISGDVFGAENFQNTGSAGSIDFEILYR